MGLLPPSFTHICRNFLVKKSLQQTDFSDSDAQIGTDITVTIRILVEKIARDVRKVGYPGLHNERK
jgi:hypothetical protein